MKRHSAIFSRFDTVVVAFPFSDIGIVRKRPALLLTDTDFSQATGTAILAMITAAKNSDWPFDVPISDLETAGLKMASCVRMKTVSITLPRIEGRIGALCAKDRIAVGEALTALFGLE